MEIEKFKYQGIDYVELPVTVSITLSKDYVISVPKDYCDADLREAFEKKYITPNKLADYLRDHENLAGFNRITKGILFSCHDWHVDELEVIDAT